MNILLLAPQPFFEIRGTPINVSRVAEALGSLGHTVNILTYHKGKDIKLNKVSITRIPNIPFINNIPVGPSLVKIPLDIIMFFKSFIMCINNRYDTIHAVEESAFFAVILSKVFRIPFIYDMDSSIPQQLAYTNFFKNGILLWFAEKLESWAINQSKSVITVCDSLTKLVKQKYPNKTIYQIEDIPIYDKLPNFTQNEINNIKNKYNISNEKIILYTGNFESYQGIELLLESFSLVKKKHNNTKLILVGGTQDQITAIKESANSFRISNDIIFTGIRPMEEIPLFLQICDILVSPRKAGSNTPLKIFTYLQSGKPIVATNMETHTQVLDKTTAILCEPTMYSFSNGIISLLDDPNLGNSLGQKGKDLIGEKYNFNIFKEKLNQAYQ